jgi:hypothetical protein
MNYLLMKHITKNTIILEPYWGESMMEREDQRV